ncbi:MAG: NAD(+) synthase [Gammaproteobacteria bacterium AqS3]|nr:NAD(+) synthase [Gammaproteobacteria bacterium AqS3]
MNKVTEHITKWLNGWADKSGLDGFVVGVSGGIDSALASKLCALSGRTSVLISMPLHQAPDQLARARAHIEALCEQHKNCSSVEIDLTEAFDTLHGALKSEQPSDLALANTRARLRMTTLYAIAQTRRCLVVGTGNRVEDFGVGFFTKYGDGGVDISPIADLMKSHVYRLARHLKVAEAILDADPTDGLWDDGRTDLDQMQVSYAELEWAMQHHGDAADLTEKQRGILSRYNKLRRANLHKMEPVPICKVPQELLHVE